jgi:hypothetical protein
MTHDGSLLHRVFRTGTGARKKGPIPHRYVDQPSSELAGLRGAKLSRRLVADAVMSHAD